MNIHLSMLFCVCIALTIPLLVFSSSNQAIQDAIMENRLNRIEESYRRNQQPHHSLVEDDDSNDNDHYIFKKSADFERILKPCHQIPASGHRQEYADCVRSRMLLMGRRKRRQAN